MSIPRVLVLAALCGVSQAHAGKDLIYHDDGTASVALEATFRPSGLIGLEVVEAHADDYCDIFRDGSAAIWRATNGQHYFESVRFGFGTVETDVYLDKGADSTDKSNANASRIQMKFWTVNPTPQGYANTLAHEWGHYFYLLPDEYLTTRAQDLGRCQDLPSGWCTNGPNTCSAGISCVQPGRCLGGLWDGNLLVLGYGPGDDAVFGLVTDAECTGGGGTSLGGSICILDDPYHPDPLSWPNWGAPCSNNTQCGTGGKCTSVGTHEFSVCQPDEDTSMMTTASRPHWCSSGQHQHVRSDGKTLNQKLGVMKAVKRTKGLTHPDDYNIWDVAIGLWGDLEFDAYEDVGLPPNYADPDFCEWNVPDYTDVTALADASLFVIDASGSMGVDANGVPGWEHAIDGAAIFNQVAYEANTKTGIYAFGDEMFAAQWHDPEGTPPAPGANELTLGNPVDFTSDNAAIWPDPVGVYVAESHGTNLCSVLEGAAAAFESGGLNDETRQVVLLTDGRFSTWPGSDDGTCQGIDAWVTQQPSLANQICGDANMQVNVISTGADPNHSLATWLADACNGWHHYAADEQGFGGGFQHALKTHAAASKALVAGQRMALHERATLQASTTHESYSFAVADASDTLAVSWIGSPVTDSGTGAWLFDDLVFELEAPDGTIYGPAGTSNEVDAIYRRIDVGSPDPGLWTVHLDKTLLSESERAALEVGWLASVDAPDWLTNAWVDRPVWQMGETVEIQASVDHSGWPLTGVQAVARVSGGGATWDVPLTDWGVGGDGVYSGEFAPTVEGAYSVKVLFDVIAGVSTALPEGNDMVILNEDASFVDFTAFEVRMNPGRVTASLPRLQAGTTHTALTATIDGVFLPDEGVGVSLGEGVLVRNVAFRCGNCPEAPDTLDPAQLSYTVTFDVDVAADAPETQRDLLIEVGMADYRAVDAVTVVPSQR